jgi:hypothetical protein
MTRTNELLEITTMDKYESIVRFDGTIIVSNIELDKFKEKFIELIEKYKI